MKTFKSAVNGYLMVTFILFGAAFTGAPAEENAVATKWKIDKAHSKIAFQVSHFFTPVSGQFQEYTSDIYFDPANLEESSVNLEIMVNSIDTDNRKRDGHLRSPDFFNAEKYPKIVFTSNEIVKKGENQYAAKGELTIKDVTTNIELSFSLLGVRDHPMREGMKLAAIKASHTLDRNNYNVGVGDWMATTVVGDQVEITATLELNSVQS